MDSQVTRDYSLLFGIPSLDALVSWTARKADGSPMLDEAGHPLRKLGVHVHMPCQAGQAEPVHEATTIALVGGDGTGKSVLAMHMAAQYQSDLAASAGAHDRTHLRARVLYVSSDLSFARATAMWTDFGLALGERRICFCESADLADLAQTRPTYGTQTRAHDTCSLLRMEPNDQVPNRLVEPGETGVLFADLQAGTTGDDWGYLCRLVATLPKPEPDAKPHLMVIDSVDGLFRCGGKVDAFGLERDREDCLTELTRLAAGKCHLVLLAEEPDDGRRTREQYDANVVYRLRAETTGDIPRLTVELEKTRGQLATPGRHELAFLGQPRRLSTPVPENEPPTNSYAHVYQSMGSDRSLPVPSSSPEQEVANVGVRNGARDLTGLPFLDRMVQPIQEEAGHITALIGDEGTHKLHLANAFLVAGVQQASGQLDDPHPDRRPGIGILVTTRRIKYGDWLKKELHSLFGVDLTSADVFRYQRVGLGQRTFSAERFLHLIRRSICHAAALVRANCWADEHESWSRMGEVHREGNLSRYGIRLVIDDLSRLLHDYPDVAQQAQFIKELERLIKKTGVQAMLVDTQRGQPGSVLREERDALLRSMADQVLYTWHVPFMGGSAVAVTAVPAAPRGHHATIGELRLHAEGNDQPKPRLVVDPHLDMFDGLDKSEPAPTPVQLRVHLYRETEASASYHEHARRWLSQSVPATERQLVIIETPDDYEELRSISYASGGTRYAHSQVLQVDEWWSDCNASLLSMEDYFSREVHNDKLEDPYDLFQSGYGEQQGKRRRLDCLLDTELGFGYADLLTAHKEWLAAEGQAKPKPPPIDRFPYTWDFGFLLLHSEAWRAAISRGVLRAEHVYTALTRPFSLDDAGSPCVTWAEFQRVSQEVAAGWPNHPRARALSVTTSSPGTAACLLLELWANEIGGNGMASPRSTLGTQSLLDYAECDGGKSLTAAARLLLHLLVGERSTDLASPDRPSVACRHWYSTASAVMARPDQEGRWVPALLPGRFSVRGDWFLGIGSGSRSVILARRAIDQLCSHRANSDRLHQGIGLPVRRQYQRTELSHAGHTTLTDEFGQPLPYSRIQSAALGAYGKEQDGWLWRSTIKEFARHNRVWTQWVSLLLQGWPSADKSDDRWLQAQVKILVAALEEMAPAKG